MQRYIISLLMIFLILISITTTVYTDHVLHKRNAFTTKNFDIQFDCQSTTPNFCTRAEQAVTSATKRISTELNFRQPVKVMISMFLPCNLATPPPSCPELKSIGQAIPAQSFPVKHLDDNLVYKYPSALLKQLDLVPDNTRITYPPYDIIARFNALQVWWFVGEPLPMPSDARDLEYTITHELIHGLGFGLGSVMNLVPPPNHPQTLLSWYASTPPSIMPSPPEQTMNTRRISNDQQFFFAFANPFVWERFLQVGQDRLPMSSIWQNLTTSFKQLCSKGLLKPLPDPQAKVGNTVLDPKTGVNVTAKDLVYEPSEVINALAGDPSTLELMKSMYQFATTPQNVIFDPSAWPPSQQHARTLVSLESGLIPFTLGASLSHVASKETSIPGAQEGVDVQSPGPDFLMTWGLRAIPFSDLISRAALAQQLPERPSGIGPGIVSCLLAMGYTPSYENMFTSRNQVALLVPESVERLKNAQSSSLSAQCGWVRTVFVCIFILCLII